jgi:hypothetical protein
VCVKPRAGCSEQEKIRSCIAAIVEGKVQESSQEFHVSLKVGFKVERKQDYFLISRNASKLHSSAALWLWRRV